MLAAPSSPGSPPPAWLSKLHEVLCGLGVPVRTMVVGDGALRIGFGAQGHAPAAVLRPRAAGAPGWSESDRFVLGYEAASRLDPPADRWMKLIAGVVRRWDRWMPSRLDTPAAVFGPGVGDEERFLLAFPFCAVERSSAAGQPIVEVLVRATSRCNQRCPFCSAPEHATPSEARMASCIAAAAASFPAATLSLTGGEPTLRRSLAAEVQLALGLEALAQVQVQTNAVLFARTLDPAHFCATPRLAFFVSLHALDPALYDECTGTRGQLGAAVQGIRRLLDARHRVVLNCVVNRANLEHLGDYVSALPGVLGRVHGLELHFSALICPERRPEAAQWLVRYPRMAECLEEAAARAAEGGLAVQSLRASTHASIPACLLGAALRGSEAHRPEVRPGETGLAGEATPWVKPATCRDCAEHDGCLGVPRPYEARFGLEELRPIRARDPGGR